MQVFYMLADKDSYAVPLREVWYYPYFPLWHYSGVTLNVARPDMNNYATLGVMLY